MCWQVEPLRRSQGVTVLKDDELARQWYEALMEAMVAQLSPEELLAMLSPELRRLPPVPRRSRAARRRAEA
jgi:hypothetical protein